MDGWRDYNRRMRRQQAYGRWQALVDAGPVRDHVNLLRASGLGNRRIAELAGITPSVLSRLLYSMSGKPPLTKVQRSTADKLLAIRPSPALLADNALVDATGTRRRIQALTARGWTHRALAPHLDVDPLFVGDLTRQDHVTARHARSVAAVYNQLWDADPTAHGVLRHSAQRARNLAARHGWPPPMAWDDDTIDDPSAHPDTGEARRPRGETQDEIQWLLAAGETDFAVIAARVGVSEHAVLRSLARYRAKAVAS
ncbi:hypothetical protein CTZ27_37080 [Streptomyces griseocarneus]|nr:hypothetical protein CTZ27_37080 [Streptomyces griseocarneus]